MNLTMEKAATNVARILMLHNHETYFCGGAVRDGILDLPVKDIDIATSAKPKEIMSLFPGSDLIGESFAVIIVKYEGHNFEVCSFRKDSSTYVDFRHPESISF